VVRQSRRNASAFHGFAAPHGGKKTRDNGQLIALQFLRGVLNSYKLNKSEDAEFSKA